MPETFILKVNGEELQIEHQIVVAHDILELAEKNQAITGAPTEYLLKSLTQDDRVYQWDEEVDLEKDNLFITIRNAPTPVA